MTLDFLAQVVVTVFGASAIFLLGARTNRVRRWGVVCGLIAQPAWYVTAICHEQWGLLPVFALYTGSWLRGLWTYWIRPSKIALRSLDG